MSDLNKTNTLEQANAPPGTELVIPENLPPIKVMNPGLYKNLCEQVMSIYKHCNELSYGTRKRHYEATKRFCGFLADNFRLQKFKNVEDRHFRAYVEYLIESGASPATIQSDLSGIRFFHRLSGNKNKLSKNNCLDLPKRAVGVENRAWLPEEKEKARAIAEEMGRTDVVIAFDFIDAFGLRIEEMCRTKLEYLMSALKNGQLVVPKGKGGQKRNITLNPAQRALIVRYVEYFQARGLRPGDYLISGSEKHGVLDAKRSLQNWMSYNREKFMVKDRDKIVEEGKKKRHATISWHGLRHGYAQKTHADALIENPKQAKKIVSENLGHHRYKVTKIYLAEAKTKKKTK